jgi:hypothetical protein
MTPPDRRSRPNIDDDTTGITSLATKQLLENLATDVREMRSDVANSAGVLIRVEDRQKDLAAHMLDADRRIATIESEFRAHQSDEKVWQLQQQNDVQKLSTQLALVAPLTAAHEQILQQAKGAAWATKAIYLIAGAIGVGGVQAIIHLLTSKP